MLHAVVQLKLLCNKTETATQKYVETKKSCPIIPGNARNRQVHGAKTKRLHINGREDVLLRADSGSHFVTRYSCDPLLN